MPSVSFKYHSILWIDINQVKHYILEPSLTGKDISSPESQKFSPHCLQYNMRETSQHLHHSGPDQIVTTILCSHSSFHITSFPLLSRTPKSISHGVHQFPFQPPPHSQTRLNLPLPQTHSQCVRTQLMGSMIKTNCSSSVALAQIPCKRWQQKT